MTFRDIQTAVYANKIEKNWNVTDIPLEFCLLYGEVGEAYEAYRKKLPDFGEELADVILYVAGIAQICGIDLDVEVARKILINAERKYAVIDGVNSRIKDSPREALSTKMTKMEEENKYDEKRE